MLHQPACPDMKAHVARVYDEVRGREFDLERVSREALDDYRAERLGLDPTYYAVLRQLRDEVVWTEGAEG